jgi:hypothetical protein
MAKAGFRRGTKSGSREISRGEVAVRAAGQHMSISPNDPHDEVGLVIDGKPRFIVFNLSVRNAPMPWDPESMELVEQVLARDYVPRPTWALAESGGTVRLFALRR